jgi:hypothetical protein
VNPNERVILILGAIGVGVILYMINEQTEGFRPVPQNQKESQMEGVSQSPTMPVEAGAPLDASISTHFWTPGYDDCNPGQPTIVSKHRYPAVPGGNISNVMHNGWSSMATNSPAGNDWFTNPPEAAVL